MRCPTCKQPIVADHQAFRPFCSKRCKLIDLGHWLDGSYAIPGEPASDDDLTGDVLPGDSEEPRRR